MPSASALAYPPLYLLRPRRRGGGVRGGVFVVAAVVSVSSKAQLDALTRDATLLVLEARRDKSKRSTAFEPVLSDLASDFEGKATFASLAIDRSDAAKLASEALRLDQACRSFVFD